MKKLIQKAVKVLAFLLVLALCYGRMDQVLKIKTDDMVSMVKLRQLPPDTVDVLLVGSSHIGTNVDNQQIFDEYGISSYNLWVGMQPIWNTYYCLKEALSAQSPQIVIAEVYLSTTTMDYSPKETAIKNVELLNLGINRQDGELVQRVESACDNYDATLLLGAQRDADGNLFRFSNAGIRTLNITDGALSDTDAATLSAPVKDNSRF